MEVSSEGILSPGFTAVARPGVVWLGCRKRMRSRGQRQKRLLQPKKPSQAVAVCRAELWAVKPGRIPESAHYLMQVAERSRGSAEQSSAPQQAKAQQQPTNLRPGSTGNTSLQPTLNRQPIIDACTRSQLSPSPNPLHRATNSIVSETPLFPSPIAAVAPRSIRQDDRLLVSRDRDWRRCLPPQTRRALPCSLHSFRGSASPHCMRFDSGMHADNAVSVAPSTRLVPLQSVDISAPR